MVYEACLRAEARSSVEHAGRYSLPEGIPTPPAQRPTEPETPADPETPAEPVKMPSSEPERPPLQMVDPSVSVNTVEVTPSLITRCDKSIQKFPPTFISNTWISERGAWNNHRPIKYSPLNRNSRRILFNRLF
ncbi:hypothetical protein TNCV_768211 [Trichonephila clavipes]|nr:hypothetical protein TNCV_768211 [Trichonephila clavipes]